MKIFIFRSGIRKISIEASSLDEAKTKLTKIESDAWTDPTWNWRLK